MPSHPSPSNRRSLSQQNALQFGSGMHGRFGVRTKCRIGWIEEFMNWGIYKLRNSLNLTDNPMIWIKECSNVPRTPELPQSIGNRMIWINYWLNTSKVLNSSGSTVCPFPNSSTHPVPPPPPPPIRLRGQNRRWRLQRRNSKLAF